MSGYTAVICVRVKVGEGASATSLSDDVLGRLIRVSVQSNLHLPGMFELRFVDDGTGALHSAGLTVGATVQVLTTGPCDPDGTPLIVGAVNAIEARVANLDHLVVIRGYDIAHRLQRTRRTRTFLNMTDSDIAAQVLKEAGLARPTIDRSTVTHEHVGQTSQSDWEFLTSRATEIGFELVVSEGTVCFRKASGVTASTQPIKLTLGAGLRQFGPRVTAGNLPAQVEVRVWDPEQSRVLTHVADVVAGAATIPGERPQDLGEAFTGGTGAVPPPQPAPPAVGDHGPAPSPTALVVHDRPLAVGAAIDAAAEQLASAVAAHVANTFAEGSGEAVGLPAIQAGVVIEVSGMGKPFDAKYVVSSATHLFEASVGGYVTRFEVGGGQERSLLGLASGGTTTAKAARPQLNGVCCGVVSNVNDPKKLARVKVMLPLLSQDYESDWAPVVQFGAGRNSGAMFLPEVNDQVLVCFESGDPRRPYVLGGVVNADTRYGLGGDPVKVTGMAGQVVRRGFVSAAGNVLSFHDDMPPGNSDSPPNASDLVLGTGDGNLALAIDQTAGTVTITCRPAPPASKAAAGQITIQCGDAGVVNIATGEGGSVNIDGGQSLSLKAKGSISIESTGEVAIKGSRITLN